MFNTINCDGCLLEQASKIEQKKNSKRNNILSKI